MPPGTYELSYELAGFNTLQASKASRSRSASRRNVNVELALATLQETVTVSGASPVIDTSTTRMQQNFKMEQLQSIPNGRDMWALLAVTPSVQMSRIDVGGNRAGTQTGYTAYGLTGQVRVLIEGINTTEGTGGAGFYFDYASLEEAFLGTSRPVGRNAEPRRAEPVHRPVGRQPVPGRVSPRLVQQLAAGLEHSRTRTSCRRRSTTRPIREHSNEIDRYYDHDINAGGPIKKDKVWLFGTYREQFNAVAQPNFQFDKTFDTKLWNAVGKVTYQVNQKNKLIGYYQWGQKEQPNRLPFATYTYASPEQTYKQDSGSWVYKGEWNGTVSDKLYLEARYGDFGYYFPLITNSTDNFFWHDTGRARIRRARTRSSSSIATASSTTWRGTYFLDTGKGSHTFKIGAELLKEQSWEGYESRRGGTATSSSIYTNGVSSQVIFGLPTATCEVGQPGGARLPDRRGRRSIRWARSSTTRGRSAG